MTDFASARQKMVDSQIRPNDVTDLRVLDAFQTVPREVFVPEANRLMAYLDIDVAIGAGRRMMKPVVLARMIQAAAIDGDSKVLVVGCGTGYAAAIVARLAHDVSATEADPELVAAAGKALASVGAQVKLVQGPATAGVGASSPYDVILIDGACEIEPRELYGQLKMGGRLLGVFGTSNPPHAEIVTRSPSDFGNRVLFDAYAPLVPGMERKKTFVF